MTRDEARAWYAKVLLDKIAGDSYPSATQMTMVEQALQKVPELIPEYMDVLLDKIADERFPSVPMLQRIQRVAELLPIESQQQLEQLQEMQQQLESGE